MKALLDLFKQVTQEEEFDAIKTGLAPMWAVTLLDGVNDSVDDAQALADATHAFVARTGLPAVTFGGEPTPALRDASPENADRKLLRRSDAGLLWFSELCRRPD